MKLEVGKHYRTRSGLRDTVTSKQCWLFLWRALLTDTRTRGRKKVAGYSHHMN